VQFSAQTKRIKYGKSNIMKNFIYEKLLSKDSMDKKEIELLIIDILNDVPLSPKNIRELFHYKLHSQVRCAVARLCDSGVLKLDTNMILHFVR